MPIGLPKRNAKSIIMLERENNALQEQLRWYVRESAKLREQLRKEQGIMKYKQGDVLVKEGWNDVEIQGAVGNCYICIKSGDGIVYAECELDSFGYTLKTDDPQTELTIPQIEEKLNMKSGTLRVKAEEE